VEISKIIYMTHVVARRALALPDEAISNYQETASAKRKSASQRHLENFQMKSQPL
jgi:hypothetical protein